MRTEFTEQQLADPATAVSAQAIRKCVHCGFCTATCPTYVLLGDERDSPRGRIYLMKEMLEREQQPTADVVRHIDRCLSCLACTTTCPSGVDYMHLVDHARAYVEEHYQRPLFDRLLRSMLAKVLPYRARFRWAIKLGRVASPFGALLPRGSLASMLSMARGRQAADPPALRSPAHGTRRGRVLMMQGCAEPVLLPQIRAAAVRLLNRLGYDVEFASEEGCCGALVHHLGREQESLEFAKRNVDAWWRAIGSEPIDAILITASGCGTLVKDYGFLLRNDPQYAERAAKLSALAKDVSELVTADDIQRRRTRRSARVAYHAACSLQHGQKIVAPPKALLEAAGFEVSTPAESHLCCGSAGTYNLLQPEIAETLGRRKVGNLEALTTDIIATGNVGCAVQIASYTNRPVVHVIELLDWATGGPEPAVRSQASE